MRNIIYGLYDCINKSYLAYYDNEEKCRTELHSIYYKLYAKNDFMWFNDHKIYRGDSELNIYAIHAIVVL